MLYNLQGGSKKSKLLYCVNSLLFWATLYILVLFLGWQEGREEASRACFRLLHVMMMMNSR